MSDYLAEALASIELRRAKARAEREKATAMRDYMQRTPDPMPRRRVEPTIHPPRKRERTGKPPHPPVVWTPELVAQLRELAALKITAREIASRLGRSEGSVRGAAKDHKIRLLGRCTAFTDRRTFDYDQARKLYEGGHSIAQIAWKMEVNYSVLWGVFDRLGVLKR